MVVRRSDLPALSSESLRCLEACLVRIHRYCKGPLGPIGFSFIAPRLISGTNDPGLAAPSQEDGSDFRCWLLAVFLVSCSFVFLFSPSLPFVVLRSPWVSSVFSFPLFSSVVLTFAVVFSLFLLVVPFFLFPSFSSPLVCPNCPHQPFDNFL